jgi:hypothetical protein
VPHALAAATPGSQTIELTPQDRPARGARNAVFSILLSLAVIAVVVSESGGIDLARLASMIPATPVFWLAFAALYLAGAVSEWIIFRKLWTIPFSGMAALLRKKVYNDLLLGYLGEAYFYTWARRRVDLVAAPFGAVKDVAILSAMAGNVVTLALLAALVPTMGLTRLGLDLRMVALSLGVLLSISLAMMVFRKRVFSLPQRDLVMISAIHFGRIGATILLYGLLWHLVLPDVPLATWVFLATLRMLVTRLPLVPNKDLVFAGIALVALGHQQDIAQLMTLFAGLILIANLALGAIFALRDLAYPETKPCP